MINCWGNSYRGLNEGLNEILVRLNNFGNTIYCSDAS